jgi:hypothetical protein
VAFLANVTSGAVPATKSSTPGQPKISELEKFPSTPREEETAMTDLVQRSTADSSGSTIVKQLSFVLLLLLLVVAAQGWQIARGMSVKSQSWEYMIEGPTDDQLQSRLQALGSAGWELVSARRATTERDAKTMGIYEMIFRRPVETLPSPTPPQPH